MQNLTKKLKTLWWMAKSRIAFWYYRHPSKKLKIVGVTGTNGKTTTATLLYNVAIALGYKAGLVSTVENIIVDKKIPAKMTTPDSVTLTRLFATMRERGCEYVFMEVSSHALDQNRVRGVCFAGGIFTNLTHDHLDYHKNLENYFRAKKNFFDMLPEESFALSNADDEHGKKMLEGIAARKFLYEFRDVGGLATLENSFQGEILKNDSSGLTLRFNGREIKSKLLGKFNAYNLLAVWGTCSLLGFDMKRVGKIFEDILPPGGRFEHFMTPTGVLVVVDYAHTPDALEKIFSAVKEILPAGKLLISLVGCGGDRDPFKRPMMGRIAAENSDIAIFTSDNPRTEDPERIISQMKSDLPMHILEKVETVPDRSRAIQMAVDMAKTGDIILCAGKGHEDYQEINGVCSHFNDLEEFKKAYAK